MVIVTMVGPGRDQKGWAGLSATQQAVAWLVSQALTNQQIARRLYLSPHTVNYHLRQIFQKLGINSRVDLARIAQEQMGRGAQAADAAPDQPRGARGRASGAAGISGGVPG